MRFIAFFSTTTGVEAEELLELEELLEEEELLDWLELDEEEELEDEDEEEVEDWEESLEVLLWDPVEEEVAEELPEDSVLSEEELPERFIAKEQLVAMPKQERRVKRVRGRFECFISIPPYDVEDIILGVFAYRCKKKVPEKKATIVKCARKGVRTMKKASAILYTIGAILAIFGTLTFLAFGIVMKAIPLDKIQQVFNEVNKDASVTFAKFKETWDLLGTILIIAGACNLVGCVLGFIGASFARDPNSSNVVIHIIAIIFGIGAMDVLLVLGGIFGIVGGATAQKA